MEECIHINRYWQGKVACVTARKSIIDASCLTGYIGQWRHSRQAWSFHRNVERRARLLHTFMQRNGKSHIVAWQVSSPASEGWGHSSPKSL